ncbi:5-oxoprolinase-like [Tubulanus polymorphus]|uniref:5-oxoprolinase-like n=1 Tax=Tubulanus polymorphus TaxID=672921 RepID=UPI003DA5C9E1
MNKFRFAIDRGGTFTDIWAKCPDGKVRVMKLLSEDPANYPDAPREGIRRIIEQETGKTIEPSEPIDTSLIEWIRMGTTVATNALLERKGQRMALLITSGFKDLLHIGNQARPKIFDLEIVTPDVLFEEIIEVEERIVLNQDSCQLNKSCEIKTGSTGEKVDIWQVFNEDKLRKDLQKILDKGIQSLAVVLMHSYLFSDHEQEVGILAKQMGFSHVSLSSDVMPMVRIVPRGYTACADAYLTPCIKSYVGGFSSGFKNDLKDVKVLFMQSDGGLTPVQKFTGSRAILSGPAGGVIGYALTTYSQQTNLPVIGFDMGGTSTDVSRYAGHYEHVFETMTAGVAIQAPQLDINTVAAGGGSQLFFRSGLFVVGPESAGAHPGPVCYKKGGPLAVTDANLCLGRLLPEYFPKIFGPDENEPLDKQSTMVAFQKLTDQVNEFLLGETDENESKDLMTVEQVAMGFLRVANEAMSRPIRALTQAKGYDTSNHILACFGGAGAQHACAIARNLGMSTVFVHRHAGILSAFGLALADVVHETQEPAACHYSPESLEYIDKRIAELSNRCKKELLKQGFHSDQIITEPFLHLRYKKTDCSLMCSTVQQSDSSSSSSSSSGTSRYGDFRKAFTDHYQREFGFTMSDRPIVVDDIRIRAVAKSRISTDHKVPTATQPPKVEQVTKTYFEEGYLDTKVYHLDNLLAGHEIPGPALIITSNSTILIVPNCVATITEQGDVKIQVGSRSLKVVGTELDAIQLSIFSHRFMSIAEQMGRVLQRTAISTNIKERLDFSCAMFGPDGGLVANAPHIPVHLGAMQETVQYQMRALGDQIKEGDVILSNHPCAGGSHLPDLTVITPVFHEGISRPVFYVASRGHHADIGGATPGSMPPHSKSIFEEGAVFKSFKLVKNGVFQEQLLTEALMEPRKYPGCSGTRNLHDNLSDLKAQIAANQKGIHLVTDLIKEYSLPVVQAYMAHIQHNAEVSVRDMLREIGRASRELTGLSELQAEDFMDDGTKIALKINIDEEKGSAVFDFSGTGYEVHGNCNAPQAITLSALIYCLRCMVGHDVPLNQGCLKPVEIKIPSGSILRPSEHAAVVGGNVLTSQRVVDVIFKAFKRCAASQGCMNNITFGDDSVGYYETVAGGAGAGPSWHGKSGIHTHMTNTRITDPEIIERRYPVVLQKFSLNPGSGGKGRFNGGDGVIRELLFRRPLHLSILTERRVFQPYGLNGGEPGNRGSNVLCYADGRKVNLGGKSAINVKQGDVFRLTTPGGGAFGCPTLMNDNSDTSRNHTSAASNKYVEKGSLYSYKLAQESA